MFTPALAELTLFLESGTRVGIRNKRGISSWFEFTFSCRCRTHALIREHLVLLTVYSSDLTEQASIRVVCQLHQAPVLPSGWHWDGMM